MTAKNALDVEETMLHTLFQQLNEAWGDADAYAALFTEDADYVTFDGSQVKGRTAIAESHRPLFEGFMRGSRLTGQITAIRFLKPGVALIHGKGAVIQKRQKHPSRRAVSVQTTVAIKQEDESWLITAFQNTRYRPWTESLVGKILVRLNGRAAKKIDQPE